MTKRIVAVSTLLEILEEGALFQPFLRFWAAGQAASQLEQILVSTLLEILAR
jgi:hypothetical protein